jgi:hypothetical protein
MSDFSALARRFFFGDCRTGIDIGDAGRLRWSVSVAGDPGAEDVPIGEIQRVLTIEKGREFDVRRGNSEEWTRTRSSSFQNTEKLELISDFDSFDNNQY